MPVPKKRLGRSDQGHRRSNWKGVAVLPNRCSNCGALVVSHQICGNCGFYNGKIVVSKRLGTAQPVADVAQSEASE
ncbi:MAG: 50S ribosomal protein L32 [Vampirovibrionales bacterium]